MGREIGRFAEYDPNLEDVVERIQSVDEPSGPDIMDGLFERVEIEGELVREPDTWPLHRRFASSRVDEGRAERALESLIRQGAASELVLLQRNGTRARARDTRAPTTRTPRRVAVSSTSRGSSRAPSRATPATSISAPSGAARSRAPSARSPSARSAGVIGRRPLASGAPSPNASGSASRSTSRGAREDPR